MGPLLIGFPLRRSFREVEIIEIAKKRSTTILIGGFISVMVCVFVYPFWAGDDLHNLVLKNIGTLGNFLQGPDATKNQKQNTRAMHKDEQRNRKGFRGIINVNQEMVPPSAAESHISKSKIAAMNLRGMLETGLWEDTNLLEAIPVVTLASLLVDVVSCTEKLAESIKELATLAKFNNVDRKFAPDEQQKLQPADARDNKPPHHVITINLQASSCPE
ncbi:hypothetical protein L6164_022167 [Bauhinia variegata]|uniref:Uncharacterized protein n=1 Tax=Bauhinia variegata TaxID=167791 RepID=A0ACB9MHN1_BAUVA|nr:hypothetical protein L6164_022167 [Bauhinia variegata]